MNPESLKADKENTIRREWASYKALTRRDATDALPEAQNSYDVMDRELDTYPIGSDRPDISLEQARHIAHQGISWQVEQRRAA